LIVATSAATLGAAGHARSHAAAVSRLVGVWEGSIIRVRDETIVKRDVLALRIRHARVGATINGELRASPGCTLRFRISRRLPSSSWLVGILSPPSGDLDDCSIISNFNDGYTRDVFKLVLLDNRRLRVTALTPETVRMQATLLRR
jgi:hypothetical protein